MKIKLDDLFYMELLSKNGIIDSEFKVRIPGMVRDLSQRERTLLIHLQSAYCVFKRLGVLKEDAVIEFTVDAGNSEPDTEY